MNDFLDINRAKRKLLALIKDHFNIVEEIEEIIDLLSIVAKVKEIELVI